MNEQHLFTNRLEKAKALARALYSGLNGESTPLEAATDTRDVLKHALWWDTVSHTADVKPPSQLTVDLVVDLIEFAEEIKEIERERQNRAGSTSSG